MAEERSYRHGVRAVLPLSVAVLGFGISYGVLAVGAGMGTAAPIVMSVTTFAGSAQFAAASVLGAAGTAATAILAAVLLNARYLPIGITVAPWITGGFWSRLLHAHLTVDETWAVAAEGQGRWNPQVLIGAGVVLWLAWVGGTVAGVLFGDVIGDPNRWGLDAAFPALFLALLAPQVRDARPAAASRRRLRDRPTLLAAIGGATIALILTPFTPAGVPIVAASLACLPGLFRKPASP